MQILTYRGKVVGTFNTRAEALIYCFDNELVFNSHSRRRNQLLPDVKIEGTNEEIPETIDDDSPQLSPIRSYRPKRALPERGDLDERTDYSNKEPHRQGRRWWK